MQSLALIHLNAGFVFFNNFNSGKQGLKGARNNSSLQSIEGKVMCLYLC